MGRGGGVGAEEDAKGDDKTEHKTETLKQSKPKKELTFSCRSSPPLPREWHVFPKVQVAADSIPAPESNKCFRQTRKYSPWGKLRPGEWVRTGERVNG